MNYDELRRELAELSDCGCTLTDGGGVDRCSHHEKIRESAKKFAHLPD